MNTTNTKHQELQDKMRRGEFRAARARDLTPYLNELIPYEEMVELVALAVNKQVRTYAAAVLAGLDMLYDAEHRTLPMIPGKEDIYFREGAGWLLSRALLIATEEDIQDLCFQLEASGVLV